MRPRHVKRRRASFIMLSLCPVRAVPYTEDLAKFFQAIRKPGHDPCGLPCACPAPGLPIPSRNVSSRGCRCPAPAHTDASCILLSSPAPALSYVETHPSCPLLEIFATILIIMSPSELMNMFYCNLKAAKIQCPAGGLDAPSGSHYDGIIQNHLRRHAKICKIFAVALQWC